MRELYGRDLGEGYKFADLHVHTRGSIDVRRRGGMRPHEAVFFAKQAGLSAVAITDHDNLSSSLEGREYALNNGIDIEVIPGVELTTQDGHLIGLYMTEDIPMVLEDYVDELDEGKRKVVRRSMINAIRRIHKQGGLAIAPHPFYIRLESLKQNTLHKVVNSLDPEVYFDGYEVHSMGVIDAASIGGDGYRDWNWVARDYYHRYKGELGAAIGSSDAHRLTVGRGVTAYRGDLYSAIKNQETMAVILGEADHRGLLNLTISHFGIDRVVDNLPMRDKDKARQFIFDMLGYAS